MAENESLVLVLCDIGTFLFSNIKDNPLNKALSY